VVIFFVVVVAVPIGRGLVNLRAVLNLMVELVLRKLRLEDVLVPAVKAGLTSLELML
jgi:hypothetical protein